MTLQLILFFGCCLPICFYVPTSVTRLSDFFKVPLWQIILQKWPKWMETIWAILKSISSKFKLLWLVFWAIFGNVWGTFYFEHLVILLLGQQQQQKLLPDQSSFKTFYANLHFANFKSIAVSFWNYLWKLPRKICIFGGYLLSRKAIGLGKAVIGSTRVWSVAVFRHKVGSNRGYGSKLRKRKNGQLLWLSW